ncbi:MAG: hypothetical protein AAFR35_11240 [Pseudomonadota bacterium]
MRHLVLSAAITAGLALSACEAYSAGHAQPAMQAQTSAGLIVVTGDGMSLYTFDEDSAGQSNCNGGCAQAWPPLAAPANATAEGNFTPITRADGTKQWAYKGQPLYGWQGDARPGDVTGDGVGGTWHLARP